MVTDYFALSLINTSQFYHNDMEIRTFCSLYQLTKKICTIKSDFSQNLTIALNPPEFHIFIASWFDSFLIVESHEYPLIFIIDLCYV
jgi:hypothetical protein